MIVDDSDATTAMLAKGKAMSQIVKIRDKCREYVGGMGDPKIRSQIPATSNSHPLTWPGILPNCDLLHAYMTLISIHRLPNVVPPIPLPADSRGKCTIEALRTMSEPPTLISPRLDVLPAAAHYLNMTAVDFIWTYSQLVLHNDNNDKRNDPNITCCSSVGS
jgi:hypothetical protein